MKKFDVVVIGGGPGGYVAAIRAVQNGQNVALIEGGDFGGTCLNRGCIPTKTLLANAEILRKVKEASKFGVVVGDVSFDFEQMAERTEGVITTIRKGLEGLIKANKIEIFRGYGKFISSNEIKITGQDNEVISAGRTIIATGAEPRDIDAFPFDNERIHSSTSILQMRKLPKKLVIIGGGVIGTEFASMYDDFGVEVTILELLPMIIMNEGAKLSQALTESLQKRGIAIRTEVCVESVEKTKKGVSVQLAGGEKIETDMVLVSVGRKLNTDEIGLDKAGVFTRDNGSIPVNEKMETNVKDIYAIGDITGDWMLAHVASHQGIVAANNASGVSSVLHYRAVPSVIFTRPEVGTVGMTLEKAIEAGYHATLATFPFNILGKSQAALETEGFVQMVSDRDTGQILGAQVLGHEASTLIAEMTLAINNELTIDCIVDTIHAHPTIAEAWMEAALIADDSPIHYPPTRKGGKGKRKNSKSHAKT